MFCKYCGKKIEEDAIFCPYCGKKQKAGKDEEEQSHAARMERDEFFTGLFLVLTLLLTIYFPMHLAVSRSLLSFLLTIPTIVLIIGCWVFFVETQRKQPTTAGLSILAGGLRAQMFVLLAYGVILALISLVSFLRFLNIELDININILGIHITTVGNAMVNYFGNAFALLILACAFLAAFGVIFLKMLDFFRRIVLSAKDATPGRFDGRQKPVRVPGMVVCVVIAVAGVVVKRYFSSAIYFLFYFLFYPGKALTNGIFSSLFGGASDRTSEILNYIVDFFRDRAGYGNGSMEAVKNFFLASVGSGEAGSAANGMQYLAGVLFICILICAGVFLFQMAQTNGSSKINSRKIT